MAKKFSLATERINSKILVIRGERVVIDSDLSDLYGVPTKVLNQAVKRNLARFPEDFMFRLTSREKTEVVTNCDHLIQLKFSPVLPYAFTEHGAIQAANVLNSIRAAEMSVHVVRAFIRLRRLLASNAELAKKFDELERRVERRLSDQDGAILDIVKAIRQLTASPTAEPKRRPIGFVTSNES